MEHISQIIGKNPKAVERLLGSSQRKDFVDDFSHPQSVLYAYLNGEKQVGYISSVAIK